jgi:hypothetical protein
VGGGICASEAAGSSNPLHRPTNIQERDIEVAPPNCEMSEVGNFTYRICATGEVASNPRGDRGFFHGKLPDR